jgi:multimeric flavodoxin WrbA
MKVLAVNASPKADKGNTALVLHPFLDGMRAAGADVELVNLARIEINPCHGEFNCWLRTPGKCYQQDDMQALVPKMREAAIWVFATPLYVWGVAGPMKNFMDRMMPLIEPAIELRHDHCSHPIRQEGPPAKLVLVSNCGFWEMDNFDPLLAQFKTLCDIIGFEFAGALLRPHGPALPSMIKLGRGQAVLQAAHDAGEQLVRDGRMSPETLDAVSRKLMPRALYLGISNHLFRQAQKNRMEVPATD